MKKRPKTRLKMLIRLFLPLLLSSWLPLHAATLNPCEYMNMQISAAQSLDTGNDPNFERIKQQNNREMIIACQNYEIAKVRQNTTNIGEQRWGDGS